jgi:hypothetical protein
MLKKYIENGRLLVEKLPSPQEIRAYVLEQLKEVPEPSINP